MYLPKLSNQEIGRYHSKSPVEPAANGHNGVFTPDQQASFAELQTKLAELQRLVVKLQSK
ncbi:MAG: hypothetical protein KDI79_11605 [Anaerolineae bacterium]|nr:hypothetical protein [Anaerolineae bacterium]